MNTLPLSTDTRYEVEVNNARCAQPEWRVVNLGYLTEQNARAKLAEYAVGGWPARLIEVTTVRKQVLA